MPDDSDPDVRWLSYSQIAAIRNISRPSAERMVRKHRWRRTVNNHGITVAAVPVAYAEPERIDPMNGQGASPHDSALFQDAIRAFETSIATLKEALARSEARAEAAEAGREALREQIAGLQADLSEAREAADKHHAAAQMAEGVRDAAIARAAAAEDRLAAAEAAEMARKARGLVARLRDAWRG